MVALGSLRKHTAFVSTIGEGQGVSTDISEESNDGHCDIQAYKLLQLYCQKQQNIPPEDERIPHYIWKELLENPEDQKI